MRTITLAICVLAACALSMAAWQVSSDRVEQRLEKRFVLKQDLDNLIMQANMIVSNHSAAIKELQAKNLKPEEVKP